MSSEQALTFYEEYADNIWSSIYDQVDPITFHRLSTKSTLHSLKVTCARGEIDWLAKIIEEVNYLFKRTKTHKKERTYKSWGPFQSFYNH